MNNNNQYKSLEPARAILVGAFLFVAAWYLTWRIGTVNPEAPVFSWLLYSAEIYGLATVLLHLVMTWRLTERITLPAAPGLSVDIFITTIDEPAEIVRHTVLAAINVEYPHQTWVLDDGRRPEIARLARELGCRYLARPGNADAKAGNLNNALNNSKADYVATFDADHAPQKGFLTHTLGYFQDVQVAFVQTPQDFFNLDSYQHRSTRSRRIIWTEQSLFFRVIQRGKDYWNAAFYCGSCAVLRRSALDAIDGFATGTITEDLHTSVRLHKQGYRSIYHAESLAFGVAPARIGPFLRQRVRWGQGAMQVWRREGLLLGRGLTFGQRLCYFASILTYFDGWQKGFFYLAPAIILLSGMMPVAAPGDEFLWHFIPYYLLAFLMLEEIGRGYGRTLIIEQYNMARFAAFAFATLGFFKRHLHFNVTQKQPTRAQEKPVSFMPQVIVLGLNVVAIPVGIYLYSTYRHLPTEGVVVNVVWASVNAFIAIALLSFTARLKSYNRAEYRFPIALPMRLNLPHGGHLLATVDNLSSSGCRVYGRYPQAPGAIGLKTRIERAPDSSSGTETSPNLNSASAWAKESLLLTGIGAGSDNSYTFVSAIIPLGASDLGNGLVQKYWFDRLTYSYNANNQDIDARGYGTEAALGYQNADSGGWRAAYLGARYSDIRLTPDNQDSRVRGRQLRAKAQLEAEQDLASNWRGGGIVSYVFGNRAYWARLRLQYRLPNGLYLGPELIGQGDPDYRGRAVGVALTGFKPTPKTFLGFRAGASQIEGRSREGYFAVEGGSLF